MSSPMLFTGTGKMGTFYIPPPRRSPTKSAMMTGPWRRLSNDASPSISPPRSSPPPPKTTTHPRRDSGVGLESLNWRENAKPLAAIKVPEYVDSKLGLILQLPGTQEVIEWMAQFELEDTNRPWDHPVVIVEKVLMNGEECAWVRNCTTFDRRLVKDVKPAHQQHFFLLAENQEDVSPHCGTRLAKMAPGSDTFGKRTYVNLSKDSKYLVKYSMLELFNGKLPMQFDKEAVNMIVKLKPY